MNSIWAVGWGELANLNISLHISLGFLRHPNLPLSIDLPSSSQILRLLFPFNHR